MSYLRQALMRVQAMSECAHKWKQDTDWMGDPDLIGGTMSWPIWVCRKCGQQETECPDDYEDPAELNADYERDRRIDDVLTGDS